MSDAIESHGAEDAHAVDHHEVSDVDVSAVFKFGVGLVVTVVVVGIIVFGLFRTLDRSTTHGEVIDYPLAVGQGNRLPPEPRLQTNPREDLRELRVKEEELLKSYGWVDKNAGVVRIPIDDAIKLTLERGLPARQQVAKP
ncbi:MAG TPA: hypothetical protein VGG73_04900 [Vicinamibacterales bacterium]|jgi:hypothetical protein